MHDFLFHTPTKVLFGSGTGDRVGSLIREAGGRKVLLHYGGGSAERSGLLGRIRDALRREGLVWVELGGVRPNPRLSLVREGIALGRREGVDFILAVGGGSVIDSAKGIGYGLANEGDVWDFYTRTRLPATCTPIGCVLTIAAAGSEMSYASVLTNEDGWVKQGCNNECARPSFAVMDPALTLSLPAYLTACGCVDILMHTMECYFHRTGGMEITDAISEGLLRTVMKNALILRDDPACLAARAEVMWAGSLSNNGLTVCGTDGGDWACHKMENILSGIYDVAHGAGLAAIWGSWARYVYRSLPVRFVRFATHVMGVEQRACDEETALAGIEAMEAFFRAIGMPTSLSALGLDAPDKELMEAAHKCRNAFGRPVGIISPLEAEDIYAIYRMAR